VQNRQRRLTGQHPIDPILFDIGRETCHRRTILQMSFRLISCAKPSSSSCAARLFFGKRQRSRARELFTCARTDVSAAGQCPVEQISAGP
jgi:hypothetical protein